MIRILSTIDIERAILSTFLNSGSMPYEHTKAIARFEVDEQYFTHPLHKSIVKAVRKLQKKGYAPDDLLVQELLQMDKQDTNTQQVYIDILVVNPLSPYLLVRYYNILKRRHSAKLLKVLR